MNEPQNIKISIPKSELQGLPKVEFSQVIQVVDTDAKMTHAVKILKRYNLLGFDTESKPTFKKGAKSHVSLIQISANDICFLFRVRKKKDISPLKEILNDDNIKKIGLSLHDDFHNLAKDYKFKPEGFVDLQKVVPDYNIQDASLQRIYAIIFGERISKSQQLSNWDAEELTEAQQKYAALDAWACIQIYKALDSFVPENSKYIVKAEDE